MDLLHLGRRYRRIDLQGGWARSHGADRALRDPGCQPDVGDPGPFRRGGAAVAAVRPHRCGDRERGPGPSLGQASPWATCSSGAPMLRRKPRSAPRGGRSRSAWPTPTRARRAPSSSAEQSSCPPWTSRSGGSPSSPTPPGLPSPSPSSPAPSAAWTVPDSSGLVKLPRPERLPQAEQVSLGVLEVGVGPHAGHLGPRRHRAPALGFDLLRDSSIESNLCGSRCLFFPARSRCSPCRSSWLGYPGPDKRARSRCSTGGTHPCGSGHDWQPRLSCLCQNLLGSNHCPPGRLGGVDGHEHA